MRERKEKILVVDDEEIVRESLLDWLREDGYQVEAAEDGFKALEKFKDRSWDIALVDLKMPKMDGLAADVELWRDLADLADGRAGRPAHQVIGHGNGSHAGSASSVRYGKSLMQVQVADIGTYQGRIG